MSDEVKALLEGVEARIGAQVASLATTVAMQTQVVTDHRIDLAKRMGEISSDLKHMKDSQTKIERAVAEVAKNQANCEARMNYKGTTSRLKQLERKQNDTRVEVASLCSERGDEITGQVDVTQRMPLSPNMGAKTKGLMSRTQMIITGAIMGAGIGVYKLLDALNFLQ